MHMRSISRGHSAATRAHLELAIRAACVPCLGPTRYNCASAFSSFYGRWHAVLDGVSGLSLLLLSW